MRKGWKLFVIIFSLLYICVTLFAVFKLYYGNVYSDIAKKRTVNSDGSAETSAKKTPQYAGNSHHILFRKQKQPETHMVEIWGKAAIGLYLWKHILNGELENINAGLVQHGSLKIDSINFTFRSGPGIIQTTVPSEVAYLVLVLNGRSDEKIVASKLWLDYLPLYLNLQRVAIVFLGNEQCNNDWLLPYMKSNGGKVDVVFLVYDSPLIDNIEFFQWPLGVATYRGFPNIQPEQVDLSSTRSYLCNFLGTIYKNSSRQVLMKTISTAQDQCIILGRKKWQPLETEDSLNTYIKSILKSDLTLSPVGLNTECYRIYEAMSLGSVPVAEDVSTPGNCRSPLRLLKSHNAPIIYLKDWKDLLQLLNEEKMLTLEEKVDRRIGVIEWYQHFKKILAEQFIQVINDKFF